MINNKKEYKQTESLSNWYDYLPISINDTYGDPFIDSQVDNTIAKLNKLSSHKAPIVIFTKAPYNEKVLLKLKDLNSNSMLVVMYSLTGLDEGGFSFDNRIRFINELKKIFGSIVILTRPIIKGKNDNVEILSKIVKVASQSGGLLVLGGVHDSFKMKKIDSSIENMLMHICDTMGVKSFFKSSCCAAYIKNVPCWIHDLGNPQNLDIVTKLGYNYDVVDNCLVVKKASTGDLNFLKILTRSDVKTVEIISNYNLLSVTPEGRKLECTSSWFCWATNSDTCLDCDYCIIKQIEYLKRERVEIGCCPNEILSYVSNNGDFDVFSKFQKT